MNRIYSDDRFDAELAGFVESLTSKSGPVLKLAKRAQAESYYAANVEALYKAENPVLARARAPGRCAGGGRGLSGEKGSTMAQRMIWSVTAVLGLSLVGCGGAKTDEDVTPVSLPLPTPVIAGRQVALFPLTLVATDAALGWGEAIGNRDQAKQQADSVIEEFLLERAPEAEWILPDRLRRAAAQAPGMLTDPDKMGTALLRAEGIEQIPDPLRSQLRNLIGVAGDRYALVPAVLTFVPTPEGLGAAELTIVLVDAKGQHKGQPVRFQLSLYHEDAYVLTAVPTSAMIKQMLQEPFQPGIPSLHIP